MVHRRFQKVSSALIACLFVSLFAPAAVFALPGYNESQRKGHGKKFDLKSSYNSEEYYFKDDAAKLYGSISFNHSYKNAKITDNAEISGDSPAAWTPASRDAHAILKRLVGEKIADDFKNSQPVFEGVHYLSEDLDPWPWFRLPIRIEKVNIARGHRIVAYEKVRLYKGEMHTYEQVVSFDGGAPVLRIRALSHATQDPQLHKANKAVYESWRNRWPLESEIKAGVIQRQLVTYKKEYDVPETVLNGEDDPLDIFFSYMPKSLPAGQKARLLLISHGDGGNGYASVKSWTRFAEKHRMIVVAPGYNYNFYGGYLSSPEHILATIHKARKRFNIHPRIFINGFSSGGTYAYLFAGDHPQLVAGYAAHSSGAIGGVYQPIEDDDDVARTPVLVTCGMKGPYCGSNQGFIQTAKSLKYKDARYVNARNFKQAWAAAEKFFLSIN
ncbi:MAG: hypothetical protein NXI24_07730 [bacterium]|nr:hypothetical protein [bacterium]